MWAPYNIFSGFPYESGFPYFSETHTGRIGFYYVADRMRLYESVFYHLSYLLGEYLHIGGSYVPYQVVYALLWCARGYLVFLLVRRFLPSQPMLAYVAGALVLVHSSDGALQWVGQMNHFGYMFWMLAAFLSLTVALETRWLFSIPILVASCVFEYLSLFSYESPILLILIFPLILILHPKRKIRKWIPLASAWYVVPAIYVRMALPRYTSGQQTYQQTVARKSWSVSSIANDWWFNISSSLEFWKWVRGPWRSAALPAVILSVALAAAFVLTGFLLTRIWRTRQSNPNSREISGLIWFLIVGLVVLILSFPVYLVLDTARGLWRTQMLSGIGAGIVFAALIGLATQPIRRSEWRVPVLLIGSSVIAFAGSVSAIQKSAVHRWIWEKHRAAIREVLQIAPDIKSKTIVILANVPGGMEDPFGDNMWYDMALRLVYPNRIVSGIYIYANGSRATGDNLVMKGDRWVWDGSGYPPLVRNESVSNTVVVDYQAFGRGKLDPSIPQAACTPDCSAAGLYHPSSVITGPISPRALRRYNLPPNY